MCLLSSDSGFTYTEMMGMPLHVAIGLWNAKRKIAEETKKEQQEGNNPQNMDPLALMNQAKSMMPPMPNMSNISLPNINSLL